MRQGGVHVSCQGGVHTCQDVDYMSGWITCSGYRSPGHHVSGHDQEQLLPRVGVDIGEMVQQESEERGFR
jgi:hypothetical protein